MTGSNEAVHGAELVEALQLGERQAHGPLCVFPLRLAEQDGPGYVTLRQALADRQRRDHGGERGRVGARAARGQQG